MASDQTTFAYRSIGFEITGPLIVTSTSVSRKGAEMIMRNPPSEMSKSRALSLLPLPEEHGRHAIAMEVPLYRAVRHTHSLLITVFVLVIWTSKRHLLRRRDWGCGFPGLLCQ